MKREPPVDFVRFGAVSLPIRHSPVEMLIQDPAVPRRDGEPPTLIKKTYDSYIVDARVVRRGRIRAATISHILKSLLKLASKPAKARASLEVKQVT